MGSESPVSLSGCLALPFHTIPLEVLDPGVKQSIAKKHHALAAAIAE